MLLMQQHQDGLMRRLCVIGIPKFTIKPLISLMVKWETSSGVEWTIRRLKSLKVDLFRIKAGQEPLTWVRKNRFGEWAGTLGSLVHWAMADEKNFCRVVQAFMAYTYYILPGLTETQKIKFLSAINPTVTTDGLSLGFHKAFAHTVYKVVKRRSVSCSPEPLVIYRGSPDKKAPSLFSRRSVPQSKEILNELQYFNTPGGLNLYLKYRRIYSPLLRGLGFHRRYLEDLADGYRYPLSNLPDAPVMGGEIHFLQEPGGKLRSVASPFRIHQEALRPFGLMLYDVVRSLPWDCTFDQTRAIPHIQSHLSQGGQVCSIDLSSATDFFPLSLQVTALRAITNQADWDYVNLFVEISRSHWNSAIGDLQWTKGQPLGLFPSFAAFTLTHGLLLLHLAGGHYDHQFFIVGDDVVILSENLRLRYIDMLERMGCPWSTDKSLNSNKLSEFAGKVITPTMVIPQLKWRKMSDDNFLDICRLLGSRSRALLTRRQKSVFDKVANLCGPIGLNFSLPGDNLELMIKRTLDFYQPEKEVLGALMGLRSRINNNVYSTQLDFNSDELKSIAETFDEKVKSVMSRTIFSRWEALLSMGLESCETLPEALGLKPRLPTKEFESTRLTTLDRYERLVGFSPFTQGRT